MIQNHLNFASKAFRRSIYFVRDLVEGSIIGQDIKELDQAWGYLLSFTLNYLVKPKTSVTRGTPTDWDLFE